MRRRVMLVAVLVLALPVVAGCGSQQQTHGVLGEQATLKQTRMERQMARIDWTLRRAERKLAHTSGPAHARVLALTQKTLRTEADRLEQIQVAPRLASRKATVVLALRALARDGTLKGADVGVVRAALENLGGSD
jgi:N-acyl-L-homoserine lactone synthetase